jgi:hypothetical protein
VSADWDNARRRAAFDAETIRLLHRHTATYFDKSSGEQLLRREILGAVEPGERVTAGDVFYRLERRLPGLTREEAAAWLERLHEDGLLGRSGAEPPVYDRPT